MILEHRVKRNIFGYFRWRAVFSVGQNLNSRTGTEEGFEEDFFKLLERI
jgi:hypothetical protein